MQRLGWLFVAVALFQFGCDAGGTNTPLGKVSAPPNVKNSDDTSAGVAGQTGDDGNPIDVGNPAITNPGVMVTQPPPAATPIIDTRAAVLPKKLPPPISGGTLIVLQDGTTAVAADPDRDRVSIVDLPNAKVLGHIALKAGDEPGRLVEDAAGRVHVALRGAGEIATLDVGKLKVSDRRSVCGAPRGIAYDAANDSLRVACTEGQLVTMPASGGSATQRLNIEADLRDVVIKSDGSGVMVSQFKKATLLDVDGSGVVMARHRPADENLFVQIGAESALTGPRARPFQPALARRTIALGSGRYAMLHARELADTVEVPDPHAPDGTNPDGTVLAKPDSFGVPGGGNAYGGGGCNAIVQTGIAIVDSDGSILQSANVSDAALAVDMAVSPNGSQIAIANAGERDLTAPINGFGAPAMSPAGFIDGSGNIIPVGSLDGTGQALGSVSLVSTGDPFHSDGEISDCSGNSMSVPGQPTAVAYTSDGALVVQSREPASLLLMTSTGFTTIALGGNSVLDTGHELFHRDAGAGIACASCHGEAGDDGHVWHFSDSGARRTQQVNVGLGGTEPFHWSGDMKDLPMLVDRVFVGRMGGVSQSPARVDALSRWLFAQHPPERIRAANDKAALRGKALFESADVGCASCHNGAKLTDNKTVDVGTGGLFQVPSLIGVGYRAPFIHTGCAKTLRDRFDPACGGDKHGNTKDLSDKQIDDLTAYLETL
jgi:mono/diheme cytochrome c family protein